MKSVLLVEDNEITQEIVKTSLKTVCELTICGSVLEARAAAEAHAYDLILLDLNLPDGDGFDFYVGVRTLETYRQTPILFLTSRGDTEDKVRGFSMGAEDYIVKPFNPLELQARVSARLRKLESAQTHADQFNIGPFHIRSGSQKISLITPEGDLKLELTGNQFKILFYLIRKMDHVVAREELLKDIWGSDVNVSARTIDTHIYAIRRELGNWSKLITSVPGKGFRLSLKQALEKKPSA